LEKYRLSLLEPPQNSEMLPLQVIEQSVPAARLLPDARALSQKH